MLAMWDRNLSQTDNVLPPCYLGMKQRRAATEYRQICPGDSGIGRFTPD